MQGSANRRSTTGCPGFALRGALPGTGRFASGPGCLVAKFAYTQDTLRRAWDRREKRMKSSFPAPEHAAPAEKKSWSLRSRALLVPPLQRCFGSRNVGSGPGGPKVASPKHDLCEVFADRSCSSTQLEEYQTVSGANLRLTGKASK